MGGARGGEVGGAAGNFKMVAEAKQDGMAASDRGDYYNTMATITFFSKDKALYKACGEMLPEGKECMKKVVESGDGTYRCEKCMKEKSEFKWRMILQLNMADASDNNWATCFQDYAEDSQCHFSRAWRRSGERRGEVQQYLHRGHLQHLQLPHASQAGPVQRRDSRQALHHRRGPHQLVPALLQADQRDRDTGRISATRGQQERLYQVKSNIE